MAPAATNTDRPGWCSILPSPRGPSCVRSAKARSRRILFATPQNPSTVQTCVRQRSTCPASEGARAESFAPQLRPLTRDSKRLLAPSDSHRQLPPSTTHALRFQNQMLVKPPADIAGLHRGRFRKPMLTVLLAKPLVVRMGSGDEQKAGKGRRAAIDQASMLNATPSQRSRAAFSGSVLQ